MYVKTQNVHEILEHCGGILIIHVHYSLYIFSIFVYLKLLYYFILFCLTILYLVNAYIFPVKCVRKLDKVTGV